MTRSVAVAAPPRTVLDLLSDPQAIPRWAPAFAQQVRPLRAGRWRAGSGDEEEFDFRVLVSRDAGTVDFLAGEQDRGLFTRVVPNGDGSQVLFALVVGTGTPPEVLARETATIERELDAVRGLCEALTARELRELCLGLPDTTEEFVFNDPQVSVFKVSGKVFAISKLTGAPLRVSVKCDPGLSEQLRRDHHGIETGYHLNKRHWITIKTDSDVPARRVRELIEDSYELVNPTLKEDAS